MVRDHRTFFESDENVPAKVLTLKSTKGCTDEGKSQENCDTRHYSGYECFDTMRVGADRRTERRCLAIASRHSPNAVAKTSFVHRQSAVPVLHLYAAWIF